MVCLKRMLSHTSDPKADCDRQLFASAPEAQSARLLVGALLLLFGAYSLIYFGITAYRSISQPIDDLFGFWSYSRFVLEHPPTEIYNPAILHAAQVALGMDPSIEYPCPYPPSFLLALWPLGLLSQPLAYAALIGITLPLFVWATTGGRWRSWIGLAAIVAPATTITIIAGQAAMLAAALMAGGLRLAPVRPVLAGVLLGLLIYKPQMAVLVPVALLAAGLWRTIAAAVVTGVGLMVLSSIAFGWSIWPAWISGVMAYSGYFAAESGGRLHLMPTVYAALPRFGVSASAAQLVQAVTAIVAAGAVWDCFRRGATPLAAAALMTATFLATPYAFAYDMPMIVTAVLWTVAERQRSPEPFGATETFVLTLAMVAPITLLPEDIRFPVAMVSLVLLLGLIVRQCRRSSPVVVGWFVSYPKP
jgi:Glycosyltransferase family 87